MNCFKNNPDTTRGIFESVFDELFWIKAMPRLDLQHSLKAFLGKSYGCFDGAKPGIRSQSSSYIIIVASLHFFH
jgi:hypothetical protein